MLLGLSIYVTVFLLFAEAITIAFESTGLSTSKARFQTLTLLFTIGYSTKESELIIGHPIRRKIASITMIVGYISTRLELASTVYLVYKFKITRYDRLAIFVILLLLLLIKFRTRIEYIIKGVLLRRKWYDISKNNIYYLLSKDYGDGLRTILVDANFKYLNQTLEESGLRDLGINVLSVDKGSSVIRKPNAKYVIRDGDALLAYCDLDDVKKCFNKIK